MSRYIVNTLAIVGWMFGTTCVIHVLLTAPAFVAMGTFSARWFAWALPLLVAWSALTTRAVPTPERAP